MRTYASIEAAVNAIRRLAPGVGDTFELYPAEVVRLSRNAELAFFLRRPFALPTKAEIQQILRMEAKRLLLRRKLSPAEEPTETAAVEAHRVITRLECALPQGSAARLVLDVSLGHRTLRTQDDHEKYARGIPALSSKIHKTLTAIYGPRAAKMFRSSIGALAVVGGSAALVRAAGRGSSDDPAAGPAAPVVVDGADEPDEATGSDTAPDPLTEVAFDPLAVAVRKFRRKRGEKGYWYRFNKLDPQTQVIILSLLRGSSRTDVKSAYEGQHPFHSSTDPAPVDRPRTCLDFDVHIQTIESVFGLGT